MSIVIGASLIEIARNPDVLHDWRIQLGTDHGNPLFMIGAALVLFPKLALGLSGFETGVLVMPLVKGDPTDTPDNPAGRIRNTHRLLTTAAVIMSVLLILSSIVTTVLIPPAAFEEGGEANGRALAYLAHELLGDGIGTVYDISTITILWFAGASALAGLLNIVPRFLPRYGMAPGWAHAHRPLVLVFMIICFLVTLAFRADVDAQAGAYATGVLAVITSASVAVTLAARRKRQKRAVDLLRHRLAPLHLHHARHHRRRSRGLADRAPVHRRHRRGLAALAHPALDRAARIQRHLRRSGHALPREPARNAASCASSPTIPTTAPRANTCSRSAKSAKRAISRPARRCSSSKSPSPTPRTSPPRFRSMGKQVGEFKVLRAVGSSIPNTIAAVLLAIRDETGCRPHVYFGWTEGNPLKFLARFIFFGEGDIAPVTHEVLRKAEPDPKRRPAIHVG